MKSLLCILLGTSLALTAFGEENWITLRSIEKGGNTFVYRHKSAGTSETAQIIEKSGAPVYWSNTVQLPQYAMSMYNHSQILDGAFDNDSFYALISINFGILWIKTARDANGEWKTIFEERLLQNSSYKTHAKKITLTSTGDVEVVEKDDTKSIFSHTPSGVLSKNGVAVQKWEERFLKEDPAHPTIKSIYTGSAKVDSTSKQNLPKETNSPPPLASNQNVQKEEPPAQPQLQTPANPTPKVVSTKNDSQAHGFHVSFLVIAPLLLIAAIALVFWLMKKR